MQKDKIIGAVILVIAVVLILGYTVIGPISLWLSTHTAGWEWLDAIAGWGLDLSENIYLYAMMLPLWLVVVLVGVIAGWIGISMITTPPPVPLEELEEELEAEEAKSE